MRFFSENFYLLDHEKLFYVLFLSLVSQGIFYLQDRDFTGLGTDERRSPTTHLPKLIGTKDNIQRTACAKDCKLGLVGFVPSH